MIFPLETHVIFPGLDFVTALVVTPTAVFSKRSLSGFQDYLNRFEEIVPAFVRYLATSHRDFVSLDLPVIMAWSK